MSRKKKDPLGLNRRKKAFTLKANKMRGERAEIAFKIDQRLQGHDVKKVHKGRDFVEQKKDFLTGKNIGKPFSVEVKTKKAKLSDAQKKRKKKEKRSYKVARFNI